MKSKIYQGNCLDSLKKMADNSVDSIVTDPPYGLSFMGKKWDYDVPSQEIWEECLRVLKPGGHLLAFAGTRTQHRMAVRIEDAGFEIRDMIAWVYGSGFPKSLDVSKAIDKAEGAEREVTREGQTKAPEDAGKFDSAASTKRERRDTPATDAASQWDGWGTALKPALEPITVARKPLSEKTIAANVLLHGTGGINIDGCRIPTTDKLGGGNNSASVDRTGKHDGWQRPWMQDEAATEEAAKRSQESTAKSEALGRWPANFVHDGSEEVVSLFPHTKSGSGNKNTGNRDNGKTIGNGLGKGKGRGIGGDSGSAARFFYCPKASKSERGEGNNRPTVKPIDLMKYLCRLVTPPNGTVLDPFLGSGTTGVAAVLEGFNFVGCELSPEYIEIAEKRIKEAEDSKNSGLESLFE